MLVRRQLMTTDYKRCIVYVRTSATEPYIHESYSSKEEALNHVRKIKELLKIEPKVDLVESAGADVLHFKFKGTGTMGRIIFLKRELAEWVHCPSCGNTLLRDGNNKSECHWWVCDWVYDHDNGIWRVETLTKSQGRWDT
jgi:hypothetical protein